MEKKEDNKNSLMKEIIKQAKQGNLEEIKSLVEQGGPRSVSALKMATENGDLEIIKYFIESNLKIRDESKRELLNIAAYEGHLHVIKYFETLDYNLHIDDDEPLQEALFGKKMNIAQYLIDKGANIRAREDLFLKDSCSNNDVEVMQYLFNLYEDKAPAIKIIKRYTQKDIKNWIDKYLNALNLNNDLTNNLKENNTKTINKIKI